MARRGRQPPARLPPNARPPRPPVYSRLWHMDADSRRHHGRRRWDSGIIEKFVAIAASVEAIYPPDWSDADCVRLRTSGRQLPVAELQTHSPDRLTLTLRVPAALGTMSLVSKLQLPVPAATAEDGMEVYELELPGAEDASWPALADFLRICLSGACAQDRA